MPKLININEDVPSEFFIFVNQLNPMTYHNFNYIGQFSSAAFSSTSLGNVYLQKYLRGEFRYLPYEPVHMDSIVISPFFLTVINDYRIEYDAEIYREQHHPLYPSRLSAIYAFENRKTCEIVSKKYRWSMSDVYEFKLLEHPLNRVAKVNMEHMSLARHAYKISMLQDPERLWKSYWSALGNLAMELPGTESQKKIYESGVIWEYLIEGVVKKIT